MRDQFSSKLYIESETKNIGIKILMTILIFIVAVCILIKLIVGDFSLADVPWLLVALLVSQQAKARMKVKYVYGYGQCFIDYDKEKMTITYPNINAGRRGFFKDINVIRYDDIESIEFGKEIGCFRILARGCRERTYVNPGKVKTVRLATADELSETYIYVLEPEDQEVVLKNIQRHAGFIVTVLEKEE